MKKMATNIKWFLGTWLLTGFIFEFAQSTTYEKIKVAHQSLTSDFKITIFLCAILISCLIGWKFLGFSRKILETNRFDVIFSIFFGLLVSACLNKKIIEQSDLLIGHLLFLNLILLPATILSWAETFKKKKKIESNFYSDNPEEELDLLDTKAEAENFALTVVDNLSTKNFVFAIDAPWGLGKTTFLKYCKKYWAEKNKDSVIVLNFEALRFKNSKEMFNCFISEVLSGIQRDHYLPEVTGGLKRYARTISDFGVRLWGISFNKSRIDSWEDRLDELKKDLKFCPKKIIVIIDDLDRLYFKEIKIIFDIVKKSFDLPNVNYILCYDTEVLTAVSSKSEHRKFIEYSEKIINIKKTLIIKRNKVRDYFLEEALKIFPTSEGKILEAIDVIFSPNEFYYYKNFVGDLRKVKRVLNLMKLQIRENQKFNAIDINFLDLLNLIFIYTNYPKTFRAIYDSETDGGNGIFALRYNFLGKDSEKEKYKNTKEYTTYLENLPDPNEKFLLQKVFDEKRVEKIDITRKQFSTWACFNGASLGEGRNLEEYLKVIQGGLLDVGTQFSFYENLVDELIKGETTIEKISDRLKKIESQKNFEKHISLLFRHIAKNIDRIPYEKTNELIEFILSHLKEFTPYGESGWDDGLSRNLILDLIFILNKKGEKDTKEIADQIFRDQGIVERISKDNGIVGFYKLLNFRLYCCIDREGGFDNIYKALIDHQNPSEKTEMNGNIIDLLKKEMRELSQKCYSIFKEKFSKKNLFEEVKNAKIETIVKYEKPLNPIDEQVIRNSFIAFIIYQISNIEIHTGIGCGYYNLKGKTDRQKIKKDFNEYLFNTCFDTKINLTNVFYFLDFIMMFSSVKTENEQRQEGKLDEIKFGIQKLEKTLEKNQLKKYWIANHEFIKKTCNERKADRTVYEYGKTMYYKENLKLVFEMLDTLLPRKKK
ncbi:MAG: P-loop NTPase fold protein [Candidatus Gracilibacteria bacterium]